LEKTPSPYGPNKHPMARNPRTGVMLSDLQRGTTRTETIRNVNMSWPRDVVVAANVSVISGMVRSGMVVSSVERNSFVAWWRVDGRVVVMVVERRVGIVERNSVSKGSAVSDDEEEEEEEGCDCL